VKANNEINTKWLFYLLGNMNLNQYSMAAAQPGLAVINLPAYFPALSEQKSIVAELDKRCADIDRLIVKLQEEIALFAEYHTRLIFDVVTGKMDVRGVGVPEYEDIEETNNNQQDLIEVDDVESSREED
jgi:type I restriction enzyme S subunit